MSDTAIAATVPSVPATGHQAWHNASGFGFRDILDTINPLQHLPVISSIYRWLTGDRPGEAAKLAGDALYGGPIGVAVSLVSAATEDSKGRDLGEQVLAKVFGSDKQDTPAATAVASASPDAATAPTQLIAAGSQPAPAITTPEPSAATTGAIAEPVARPDHAPMPLYGGVALPPPEQAASAGAAQGSAAQAFLAHNAMVQRQISQGAPARPMQNTPIPLDLPAGTLPPKAPALPPAPTAGNTSPINPTQPLNVSQKMLDALDKYMKMEKERQQTGQGGANPGQAPAPSVDMSM